MRATKIEPGLLQVFRLFTGARLALLALTLCSSRTQRVPRFPQLSILEAAFLLGYLSWPWLRRRLGRSYLPLALSIASVGPIFEQAITVRLRMLNNVPSAQVASDSWLVLVILFVPLVLIAWQYRFRTVLSFCAGTAVLELVLGIPLTFRGGPAIAAVVGLVVMRLVLYVLVGYLVVRLMTAQRIQREELALKNEQLARYATTMEQLSVSRERNRMARELHDTLAHTLSAVSVQLEALDALWDSDPTAAQNTLTRAQTLTRDGLQEARRALQALRAKPLEDLGLALAIQRLAETSAERAGLTLRTNIADDVDTLRPEVEQSLYRVAEEAMNNIVRHANARNLTVALRPHDGKLQLEVADDGIGFEPAAQANDGRYGLVGMHERATLCGGTLEITSSPGKGTTVRLAVEG